MNYIDWVILAILLWGAWRGYSRGVLSVFTGVVGYLAGLAAALIYAKPLAFFLEKQFAVTTTTANRLGGMPPQSVMTMSTQGMGSGEMTKAVEGLSMPAFLKEQLLQQLPATGAANFGQAISHGLAVLLIQAAASIILILLATVLVRLLSGLVTRGIRYTVMGWANRVLGLVAGLAINGVILAVALGVISPLLVLKSGLQGGPLTGVAGVLDRSVLAPYLMQVFGAISAKLVGIF